MNSCLLIYLALFLGSLSRAQSDLPNDNQTLSLPPVGKDCTPNCLKLLTQYTEHMDSKLDACEKKNSQMSVLQSQLAVLKYKENICDKTIRERELKCKNQDELDAEIRSLKNLMLHLSAQSKLESEKLQQLLKQIEDYRIIIEYKNEMIRNLETKSQMFAYTAALYKLNSTPKEEEMLKFDFKPEKYVQIWETSCLRVNVSSEIREIKVPGLHPFPVLCEGTVNGTGWTVVQQRVSDAEDFNRDWTHYRNGFGFLETNFFIGLEKLYYMTKSQPHELYIKMETFTGEIHYAQYSNFLIGSEEEDYELKDLGEYSGDAGDALELSRNMKFTTFDRDNDKYYGNCAKERGGAWWYNQCSRSNLNGRYYERELDRFDGIFWWNLQGFLTLKKVQMMIRPTKRMALPNKP